MPKVSASRSASEPHQHCFATILHHELLPESHAIADSYVHLNFVPPTFACTVVKDFDSCHQRAEVMPLTRPHHLLSRCFPTPFLEETKRSWITRRASRLILPSTETSPTIPRQLVLRSRLTPSSLVVPLPNAPAEILDRARRAAFPGTTGHRSVILIIAFASLVSAFGDGC